MTPTAEIGIIGGSGFYSFLEDPELVAVGTPFGEPSAQVAIGAVGRPPRWPSCPDTGRRHQFPPHRVNYRANLWALRSVGVRQVLAPCAVGSLDPSWVQAPSSCRTRWWTGPGVGRTPSTTPRAGGARLLR